MLRDPFFKGLRDQTRPLLMWIAGVAFYVALLMAIYPSIRKSASSLQGYVQSLPAAVKAAFLGSGDFSSPVGYVNTELLSWLAPIVLIAFAIAVGARSLAGEEESGTLSLLLANTVGRRRLVLQKYAAMLVVVGVLGAAFWLSLVIATRIAGTPVGVGTLASAFVRLTLLGLAIGSVTFAVGAATGRRQVGIAAGAGLGVLMYLLNTLAVMNETIRSFRYVSLFHYAGGASPLGKGLDAGGVLVPLVTAAVLLVAAVALFERRDVRV
jgi:beta-exotoxin I transport system permease protein